MTERERFDFIMQITRVLYEEKFSGDSKPYLKTIWLLAANYPNIHNPINSVIFEECAEGRFHSSGWSRAESQPGWPTISSEGRRESSQG